MKLARIDHIRCDEYSGTTFVWIEDDMTEEKLQEAVDKATEEYLNAVANHMAKEKPGVGSYDSPTWENHRDRLVGDVLDEQAEKRRIRAEYDKSSRAANRGFDEYLRDQEGIEGFWDRDPDISAEVYWGHRHSQTIEYGETKIPRFSLIKKVRKTNPGLPVIHVIEEDEWL